MRRKFHRHLGILWWKKIYIHVLQYIPSECAMDRVYCITDSQRVLQLSIQKKDEEKQHHLHELFLEATNDSRR